MAPVRLRPPGAEPKRGGTVTEQITERPAEPGELCTCGRPAVVVYLGSEWGAVGACLIQDGGSCLGPCSWCGDPRSPRDAHGGRCPDYRLRLDQPDQEPTR
jgi:hypothetical protein